MQGPALASEHSSGWADGWAAGRTCQRPMGATQDLETRQIEDGAENKARANTVIVSQGYSCNGI
eukprot:2940852-Alexandrium_andersonii.AAC.1